MGPESLTELRELMSEYAARMGWSLRALYRPRRREDDGVDELVAVFGEREERAE